MYTLTGEHIKWKLIGEMRRIQTNFTAGKIGVYSHLQKAYFDDVVVSVNP